MSHIVPPASPRVSPAHRVRTGFTMIEILAVVIIFGVLVTVSMPRVQGIMRTSRVNAAAAIVAGDFNHAFTLAARSRRPVRLACNETGTGYTVSDRDNPAEVMVTRSIGTDKDMNITEGKCSAASVDFFPNGLASSAFDITLVSVDDGRLVSMTRVGKVRISKP